MYNLDAGLLLEIGQHVLADVAGPGEDLHRPRRGAALAQHEGTDRGDAGRSRGARPTQSICGIGPDRGQRCGTARS